MPNTQVIIVFSAPNKPISILRQVDPMILLMPAHEPCPIEWVCDSRRSSDEQSENSLLKPIGKGMDKGGRFRGKKLSNYIDENWGHLIRGPETGEGTCDVFLIHKL